MHHKHQVTWRTGSAAPNAATLLHGQPAREVGRGREGVPSEDIPGQEDVPPSKDVGVRQASRPK